MGHVLYKNALDLQIKRKSLLIVISVLSSLLLYLVYHYGRYVTFQTISVFELFGGGFSDQDIEKTKKISEYVFLQETGRSGFLGYILLIAKKGISIGRIVSSSKITLRGVLAWLYWLFEFGLISYFTVTVAKDAILANETGDQPEDGDNSYQPV